MFPIQGLRTKDYPNNSFKHHRLFYHRNGKRKESGDSYQYRNFNHKSVTILQNYVEFPQLKSPRELAVRGRLYEGQIALSTGY